MLRTCLVMVALLSVICGTNSFAQSFRVSEYQIEGNERIASATILAAVGLESGSDVDLDAIDAAVGRIFALGGFADVSAEMTELQGAKIVTFVVKELPLIRKVEFSGNDELSEEKLRPLLKLRAPSLLNQSKIDESLAELKKAYIEDGYHAVSIKTEIKQDVKNEATLVFDIVEGDKVLIKEIRFVGNNVFDKDDLMDQIETRERWFLSWLTGRGAYLEETMNLDIERIKAAYYDVGYQDVKVKPAQVSLIDNKYLDVMIEIDEGPQYKVGTVDISGDLMKDEEELLQLVTLKQGDVFGRAEMRKSILALTDLYADNGYAYVNVAPLTSKDKTAHIIDLNLEIEEGHQVYIDRIQIKGNSKTRDKVIRREIPIKEGDLYNASQIKAANRKIRNLGFFEEVNITEEPGQGTDTSTLNVSVSEKPTGTFSIGVGYSSVDKVLAQGSISQDNLFGYGVRLKLSGSIGGSSSTYTLGLTDPHFLDTDWTAGFEIYKSEREYSDYTDNRVGGAIRAGHPVSENSKLYLTYRYEIQEIDLDSDVEEDDVSNVIWDAAERGEQVLSSITTEWVRNTTDYYQDPSRGGITKLSLEYAGLGGDLYFVKPMAEHRHFFPLFWGTVFSVHGAIGYISSTNGDDVPLSEKFFLGGIRNMRGFKTREVGPQDTNGDYIGGEKMSYFNFEYLFPIDKDLGLKGVLFYDTGNAWSDSEAYFSDMRHSTGAGIRWLSPLGPLRFAWGYNLDPYEGEKQSVFEFTIGNAF